MLTKESEITLSVAIDEAMRRRHLYVTLEHLLFALLSDKAATHALRAYSVDMDKLRNALEEYFSQVMEKSPPNTQKRPELSPLFQSIVEYTIVHAQGRGHDRVSGGNILAAIFQAEQSYAADLLKKQGISQQDILRSVSNELDPEFRVNKFRPGSARKLDSDLSYNSKPQLSAFLCHSSNDKPAVRKLYRRLIADGITPWLDEEDLLAGQKWETEITKAVRNSDVVIVCLSQGSVNKKGYLQKEIRYALDVAQEQPEGTIYLIPLKLEECEIPEHLRLWHWVNFFEEKGYEKLMIALKKREKSL